ncbi:MAG: peptidylprolyl isomerase [Immundisolibacterales bacterium]|nr:peptidylprolyl isomerase [Immundisolibacterales bacterium]
MNVERGRVVRLHYDLKDSAGTQIGSTRDREPHALLYGHEGFLPGIDRALAGRQAGERFEVVLAPEEAFGMRVEGSARRVSKKHVLGPKRLVPGLPVFIRTRTGNRPATILKVGSSVVDIDMNHPLAGVTVHAEIEIVDIREADREEVAHGHVHHRNGPDH